MQYNFGNCVLDPDRRELTRDNGAVALGPQVFSLLLYLVQSREHVVSKEDLLAAIWGRRAISDSTLASHINAARRAIGDNGQAQSLIRTINRKGFRFVGEVMEVDSSPGITSTDLGPEKAGGSFPFEYRLPDKPSIAVLPFQNMSSGLERDYFAEGVVEDITTALSRHRWLFVVARNSSVTYKDRAVDIKQVGRELGVRYVLEGSVRKAANRVRITGQLIDTITGAHLWAERFDGSLDDTFEFEDQIAASIVGAIGPQLEQAEIDRARRKPTDSLDARDYYMRGMANIHRGTKESVDEAMPLFRKATELDKDFASAYAMAAWCYSLRQLNGWMIDREEESAEAVRLARRAVELGKDDAVALARSGHVLGNIGGDMDGGLALIDRAVALNPNSAVAWLHGGFLKVRAGLSREAIESFDRAMRLSPLDPETPRMQGGMALAQFLAGQYDLALSSAQQSFSARPNYLLVACIIAASYALTNRMGEAQRAMEQLRLLDATLRISNLQDWFMLYRSEDRATFADGLRKAGLPE